MDPHLEQKNLSASRHEANSKLHTNKDMKTPKRVNIRHKLNNKCMEIIENRNYFS